MDCDLRHLRTKLVDAGRRASKAAERDHRVALDVMIDAINPWDVCQRFWCNSGNSTRTRTARHVDDAVSCDA
jgi:hypothetical protein